MENYLFMPTETHVLGLNKTCQIIYWHKWQLESNKRYFEWFSKLNSFKYFQNKNILRWYLKQNLVLCVKLQFK